MRTTDSNHSLPVCPNLLERQFDVLQPNQVWASDLTYLPAKEGCLYLTVTLDLHSRMVVGHTMDAQMPATLPLADLELAAGRRLPPPGLLNHRDRGSWHASRVFQDELARKGDCWENAAHESFFNSLKRELFEEAIFESRAGARHAVFEFIEVFYNRQQRHSTLGYLTPYEFERQVTAA